jgi:hypothetical protein
MLKNYKGGYKYQLTKKYTCELQAPFTNLAESDWINIHPNTMLLLATGSSGRATLTIKKGYAWDGPSGPTYDTDSFMEGSLVHDALYQLMRNNKIPPTGRKHADRLLYKLCRKDGMSWFRAKYIYHAVRLFGATNAQPKT